MLNRFGFDRLKMIPGIEPFLQPDIIVDLLDILNKDGELELISMIQKYHQENESEVTNILFYNKHQQVHKHTQEVEKELIKNVPDVQESDDYVCANRDCRSKKVRLVRKQKRGADEMESTYISCTKCGRKAQVA